HVTESPSQVLKAQDPLQVVVLVSGTGSLLQNIIDNQDDSYRVIKVVADKPCPGINRAQDAGIDTEVVLLGSDRAQWNKDLVAAVGTADVVVSAGFMKILGPEFLASFEGHNKYASRTPAVLSGRAWSTGCVGLWRESHRLYCPFCGRGSRYWPHHRTTRSRE